MLHQRMRLKHRSTCTAHERHAVLNARSMTVNEFIRKAAAFLFLSFFISCVLFAASALAATVTLGSNIKCDTLTIDAGDALDTKSGSNYSVDVGTGGVAVNGTLTANNSAITVEGSWTTGGSSTFTQGNSTVTFDGTAADQTVTLGSAASKTFHHLTINNTNATASADDIVVSGAIDINGTLTLTDGEFDISTNDPAVNTAGNVTVAAEANINVSSRTADWTFDGTSILTDNSAEDFEDVVVNGTSLTLASNMKVATMTVTSGTLDLVDSGYVLELTDAGAPLSVAGTLDVGTDSKILYKPTSASATTVETTNASYHDLEVDESNSGGSVTFSPEGATLTVAGDLTVTDGTLAMTTKTVNVTGNLTVATAGTMTASTGTINVDGATLAVNGSGSLDFTGAGSLTFSGTSFTMAASDSFTKSTSTVTFDRDNASGTVTIDIAGAGVAGTLSLYNFTDDASGNTNAVTISVDDTDTVTVENALSLKGKSGTTLTLQSDHGTNTVDFDLEAGGTQDLDYLTVIRVDSDTGVQMIPENTPGGNCTSTVGWTCGGAGTYVWDGATNGTWTTKTNWDVGRSPSGDSTAVVTITNGVTAATADEAITVADLTINSGANGSLTLNGNNLTVSGTYANNGTLVLNGNETTVSLTNDNDSGLTKFVSGSSITFKDLNPYYDVEFDKAGGGAVTFTAPAATFNVDGALTVTDGTVAMGSNAIDAEGTLTIAASGTLTSTSGNINTAGDVTIASGGTFTKGSGTWTFDGTAAKTFTDSNGTVNNLGIVSLNKTNATASNNKVTLASSMTAATLTLDGTSGSEDTIDLASYTLTIANSGSTATVLTVSVGATFTVGTSTVKFTATNSGGNVTIPALTYYTLEVDASESFNTSATSVTNLTLTSGTLILGAGIAIGENLTLTAGTLDDGDQTIRVNGDLTIQDGVSWTAGLGTLTLAGTGTTPTVTDNRASATSLGNIQIGV